MKTRFDELLPFYVNGTLSEPDRAWVESYLHEHPEAAAELRWHNSLQARLREDVPAVSSEVGLDRTLQRIRSDSPQRSAPGRAAPSSWIERVRDGFARLVPQTVLRPALAGAVAVVALQAVVIVQMGAEQDESTQLRAIKGSLVEQGPYMKVNFKPDAREADIRLLLVQVQGSLAAGPGQLGDYYLRVPDAQSSAVSERLLASGIVDAVAVVDTLPPRR
jgi:hypothetical protein